MLLWAPGCFAAPIEIVERAFVRDASGRMSLEDVVRQPQTRFEGLIERSFDMSVVWVRLRLAPGASVDPRRAQAGTSGHIPLTQELRLVPLWARQLTLYDPLRRDAQGRIEGVDLPRRAIPAPSYFVPVQPSAEPRDVWLRLDPGGPLMLSASLLSSDDAAAREAWDAALQGAALGMLVILAMVGTAAWRVEGSGLGRALGAKQMTNLAMALLNSHVYSPVDLVLGTPWAPAAEWVTELGRSINLAVSMWFFIEVLALFQPPPWARRLLRAILALALLAALPLALGQTGLFRALTQGLHMVSIAALFVVGLSCRPRLPATSAGWRGVFGGGRQVGFGALLALAWVGSFAPGFYRFADVSLVVFLAPLPILGALGVLLAIGWDRIRQDRALDDARRRLAELDGQALTFERGERQRQQEFMVMLAHELKAPLSTMGLVLGSPVPSPSMRHHADLALASMRRLIDHCAQSVELDDPLAALQPQACSLAREVDQRCDAFPEPSRILGQTPSALPPITLDPRLLAVILNNLLDNALRYSLDGSTVSVSLSREEGPTGWAQVVRLTNQPMAGPLPDPAQLFQKLYRGTAARRFSGSGLGLYLSRSLARRMGGELNAQVESDAITFTLVLPEAGAVAGPRRPGNA